MLPTRKKIKKSETPMFKGHSSKTHSNHRKGDKTARDPPQQREEDVLTMSALNNNLQTIMSRIDGISDAVTNLQKETTIISARATADRMLTPLANRKPKPVSSLALFNSATPYSRNQREGGDAGQSLSIRSLEFEDLNKSSPEPDLHPDIEYPQDGQLKVTHPDRLETSVDGTDKDQEKQSTNTSTLLRVLIRNQEELATLLRQHRLDQRPAQNSELMNFHRTGAYGELTLYAYNFRRMITAYTGMSEVQKIHQFLQKLVTATSRFPDRLGPINVVAYLPENYFTLSLDEVMMILIKHVELHGKFDMEEIRSKVQEFRLRPLNRDTWHKSVMDLYVLLQHYRLSHQEIYGTTMLWSETAVSMISKLGTHSKIMYTPEAVACKSHDDFYDLRNKIIEHVDATSNEKRDGRDWSQRNPAKRIKYLEAPKSNDHRNRPAPKGRYRKQDYSLTQQQSNFGRQYSCQQCTSSTDHRRNRAKQGHTWAVCFHNPSPLVPDKRKDSQK